MKHLAEEIGSAYLTIKPKMDDGFKSEAESSGSKSGSFFGSAFAVAAGELIAGAIAKLGSSLVDVFKNSFDNYANYEQLVGGIDTLFKESSETVQRNAQQAFKTVGMSANDYMENVTSFSASLLAGLGGDTAQAADIADMAMRDMSDNANKMGSSMESITNAYQGFAKQNYTMLDNLKLGYGGTKTEMERLLKDASAIAGVQFNIDSYSDVIQAIHVMQEQMGIAGTTAKEAEGTISGSIAMLQASWQNFTTELMKSDADLDARTKELVDSIVVTVENIAPRLLVFAQNLFAAIPGLIEELKPYIDQFIQMAGEFIEQHQPEIQAASEFMFEGIKNALGVIAELAIQALIELIGHLVETFPEWYPKIQEAAFQLFMKVVEGFANGLTPFMNQVNSLIQSGLNAVGSFIGGFFNAGYNLVVNIINGIGSIVSNIASTLEQPFNDAYNFIIGIPDRIISWFSGLGTRISNAFGSIDFPSPHVEYWDISVADWHVPIPYVSWYGKGGFADEATISGSGNGYGERGLEMYWPSYAPYFDKYAKGIAEHMPASGVDIHDCTFNVRKDSDIRAVAIELNTLINRQTAGGIA